MTGLSACLIRRTAGVLGVLAAVALIAAPVALANNDTITAAGDRPVLGRRRHLAVVHARHSAMIDWGDGTAASRTATTRHPQRAVSGTHTYATSARHPHRHGHAHGRHLQRERARHRQLHGQCRGAAPQFTQCPAVDANTGCQYLITVNNGTETVLQDTNQGPYEGSEDSLIGVQNNSSSPVSELPLAVPGSDLFSFDGDGLCNPGAASGSVRLRPRARRAGRHRLHPGHRRRRARSRRRPVSPPATSSRAHRHRLTQNGYEGPTSWFSNVSQDTSSGVVHFSPAHPSGRIDLLQPRGAAGRFEHRRRRHGATVQRDARRRRSPAPARTSPPSSTRTGQATTAYFQYGLDLKYSKFGGSGPNYTNSTPVAGARRLTSTTTS